MTPSQYPARPPRVGFVLHAMNVAGAEMLVRDTVRRLGPRIEPTVFCLDRAGPMADELRAGGVDVVPLDRRPGRDWGVAWRLAGELAARRIDVLHAHQYSPFFYAALAKCLTGRRPRLILTEHGRHYPDVVSPLRRAVNRLALAPLADAVNACCRFSADSLGRLDGFAGRRVEVIRNGIRPDRYAPAADRTAARRELGIDPARRTVVNVARHHPVKDQATLVRGFAAAAPRFADTDLLMVGDGPLRGDLEALADRLAPGRVKFLGVRQDVPAVLAACDVFALTSASEAASLTLLEAMAAGLPPVVTAVGGNPEIVRHRREGLLVPRGDAAATAAAVGELLASPAEAARMGAAARRRVEAEYRLDDTIDAYYRLYRRLA